MNPGSAARVPWAGLALSGWLCAVGALATGAFAQMDEEDLPPEVIEAMERAAAQAPPPPGAVPPGAAMPPGAVMPPGAAMPGRPGAPSPEEIARLKAQLESLPPLEQEEMKAYYRDLGFDLEALLGISAARSAQMNRARQIGEMMRTRDFMRQPQAVLEARARLGLGEVPHPDAANGTPGDIAQWLHLQYVSGEWEALKAFLAARPDAESTIVYGSMLQGIRPGAALLPEEVLALAEASPTVPSRAQINQLAALLRAAADRHGTADMVAKLRTDTRYFGLGDAERRRRTIDFLTGAGLLRDASEYLPPLDEARAVSDGRLMLAHALYQKELASKLPAGPDADAAQRRSWELLSEIALLEKIPFETRREAMKEAVAILPRMPRPLVLPWLETVFESETLGPAALEVMAASAASVGDAGRDAEERARTIVALKEAVDMLLARQSADSPAFRVPLRMLTTALVNEMESSVRGHDQMRMNMQPWMGPQPVGRDVESLARAIPGRAWLDALEPSLASRAAGAAIAVATSTDNAELALELLRDATRRTPREAERLASGFLQRWEQKLRPRAMPDEDQFYFFYRWNVNPAAPLTRGRQRRNMELLRDMVVSLKEIGLDPNLLPRLAGVFQACHGATEVYQREDVEKVFGALDQIPPAIGVSLAQAMAGNLGGDWRDRAVHRRAGVKRTDAEIAGLVDRGYDLALSLMDSALASQRDSWRLAALKAALAYDRQIFLEEKRTTPSGKLEDVRSATFAALEEAAQRYAREVAAGAEREDIDVYLRWFGVAMGAPGLRAFRSEDIPAVNDGPDDPIERIRRALAELPPDVSARHRAEFARAVAGLVGRADAGVKPKLVRHALRIVGDSPAASFLRGLDTLYHELVRDEIRLRLTVDGDDRVGVNEPFGVMLSMRCTASVERETGGFSKYLQTSVPIYQNNRYQEKNYREGLEKDIRDAFGKGFELQAISFFDPFIPSRGVVEDGQEGWVEKPFAYLIVSRKDPSVDRLPSIPLEMQFSDATGPVTLVATSNAPALAVGEKRTPRPCPELSVLQLVDTRSADETGDPEVILEVRMKGKGILPPLRESLVGLEGAIEGYRADLEGIRETPIVALGDDQSTSGGRFFYGPPKPPKGGYPEPDENGIYRPTLERSWTLSFRPERDGASLGGEFTLPTLHAGTQGSLESRRYADMDIVAVSGTSVPVSPRASMARTITIAGLGTGAVAVAGLGFFWIRKRGRSKAPRGTEVALPSRLTPMSTVTALRRMRREYGDRLGRDKIASLDQDIEQIESRYFGKNGGADPGTGNGDLSSPLRRWAAELGTASIIADHAKRP